MADTPDKESKTEQATEKRLQESIEKGQAPVAREPGVAASLLALWLAMGFTIADGAGHLTYKLALLMQKSGDIHLSAEGDGQAVLIAVGLETAKACLPTLFLIGALGVLASIAQSRNLLAWSRLAPDVTRLSPARGMQRLLSKSNFIEFGKTILKLGLLTIISIIIVRSQWLSLVDLQFRDTGAIPGQLVSIVSNLLFFVAWTMVAVAAVDVALSHAEWLRGLRMTKQEIREETKQSDGDPALVARRRAIARSRIRSRLAMSVPRATVVIVNPTHYAVALRYVPAEGGAPLVVAKGTDFTALSIREKANENDIPIVENKALARSLHDSVKVDQRIPAEFYRAIADVLILLRRQGKYKF